VSVEPRSGKEFWVRNDFPVGVDVTCGPDHIFVTPLSGQPSVLLNALDGNRIAERPPLPVANRVAIDAGGAVLFDQKTQPHQLGFYDPRQDRFIWQREVAADAVPAIGAANVLGVVDTKGKASLLDAATGADLWSAELGEMQNLEAAFLFPYGGVTVFALDLAQNEEAAAFVQNPMIGETNFSGKLVGVDSENGRVLWSLGLQDQKLRTTQPFGLPVLVAYDSFQKRSLRNDGRIVGHPESILDCIDVRSGKVLRSNRQRITSRYPYYQLRFDSETNTAVIDTKSDAVELRFVSP
jgi:hypothetical protein